MKNSISLSNDFQSPQETDYGALAKQQAITYPDFRPYEPKPVLKPKVLSSKDEEPIIRFFYQDLHANPSLSDKFQVYPFLSTFAKPKDAQVSKVQPARDQEHTPESKELEIEKEFQKRP